MSFYFGLNGFLKDASFGPPLSLHTCNSRSNSPLSHGGHIGYDVCTLGMKSRRCVSNLRFAAINHAKQRSFQCALDAPLCSNNRSKGKLGITFHRFSVDKYAKESWIVRIRGDVGKNSQVSDCGLRLQACKLCL